MPERAILLVIVSRYKKILCDNPMIDRIGLFLMSLPPKLAAFHEAESWCYKKTLEIKFRCVQTGHI